jgi:uncharacterized membrane protein HdeD (DUF308 family)
MTPKKYKLGIVLLVMGILSFFVPALTNPFGTVNIHDAAKICDLDTIFGIFKINIYDSDIECTLVKMGSVAGYASLIIGIISVIVYYIMRSDM